jgi:hypothetical protein
VNYFACLGGALHSEAESDECMPIETSLGSLKEDYSFRSGHACARSARLLSVAVALQR